ncbi:MAG: hypothetical protein H0T51_11395 [Pirellulales bacterium]|nr:hypothetical protein [Pirellulales bacterium]
MPFVYSADESVYVCVDNEMTVIDEYKQPDFGDGTPFAEVQAAIFMEYPCVSSH